MNNLSLVTATLKDIQHVALNLRQADRDEVAAGSNGDPFLGMALTANQSPVWAIHDQDGQPLAILGVTPQADPLTGAVWLLGTDDLRKHRKEILRRSPALVETLHQLHPVLFNFVHAANTVHVRWLRWAGFTILREVRMGSSGGSTFYEFVRIPPCVNP